MYFHAKEVVFLLDGTAGTCHDTGSRNLWPDAAWARGGPSNYMIP